MLWFAGEHDPYTESVHALASQAWTLAERGVWKTEMAMIASGSALLIAFIALLVAVRR